MNSPTNARPPRPAAGLSAGIGAVGNGGPRWIWTIMNRMKKTALLLLLAATLFTTGGCTYYEIVDPRTDKRYYTHSMQHKEYKDNAVVKFKDEATGRTVVLPGYEVEKISQREFKAKVNQQIANQPR
jgi:hypothetical protein